jgi:hypothetical protein
MKPYSIFLLIPVVVSSNEKARQKTMRFTIGASTFVQLLCLLGAYIFFPTCFTGFGLQIDRQAPTTYYA